MLDTYNNNVNQISLFHRAPALPAERHYSLAIIYKLVYDCCMSTRLVLLGLLRDGPLHGYELKHIIEEHMGDWANIAFGSIYFALGKLREEGFVREIETGSTGRRPAKIVYEITEVGQTEFLRLLREVFTTQERRQYEIDTALAFLDALPNAEVIGFFRTKVAALAGALAALRSHEEDQLSCLEVPASASYIFSHSLAHLEAELSWSRTVLSNLESGRTDKQQR
jgi:DNA-binding PadR family transcriptional regulator